MGDSAGQAYLYNTHGDVIKLIGALTWNYQYDAYGVQKNLDPLDGNAFRYAGQYFDTESGTYYLRARYYNPATGRFTQQDAWANANRGDPLGLNLYCYCNCNPVKFYDPNGTHPEMLTATDMYVWDSVRPNYLSGSEVGAAILMLVIASEILGNSEALVPPLELHIQREVLRTREAERTIADILETYPDATIIYRKGSGSNMNLTPRPNDTDGLSYSTVMPVGESFTITCMEIINESGILSATFDANNPTHVLVSPVAVNTMPEWQATRETANENPHPYTVFFTVCFCSNPLDFQNGDRNNEEFTENHRKDFRKP